jgi:hypothetical protein
MQQLSQPLNIKESKPTNAPPKFIINTSPVVHSHLPSPNHQTKVNMTTQSSHNGSSQQIQQMHYPQPN